MSENNHIPNVAEMNAAKIFRKTYMKGLNVFQKQAYETLAEDKKLLPNVRIKHKGVIMDKDFLCRFMEDSGYELAKVLHQWQVKKLQELQND